MRPSDKQALRAEIRSRYPGDALRDAESWLLCEHVLAWEGYRQARVIGGYVPLAREADITPLLEDALSAGKTLLLPRTEAEGCMSFRRVTELDELIRGRWGLLEPPEDAEIVPVQAADLLLVPLEGVDRTGMRLGKGGGYYDRLLAGTQVLTLGIALSWQWTERVPAEPWDQSLTAAADRDGVHRFQ